MVVDKNRLEEINHNTRIRELPYGSTIIRVEDFKYLLSTIEEIEASRKAAYDFITQVIKSFESSTLDEKGRHNLTVGKEYLESAKQALLELGWIEEV